MRIALLADVHANLPALEAVLAHAEENGAEACWNLGDYVGYGPFPEETVQRLRAVETAAVAGNYDHKVLRFPQKDEKWRRTKRQEKWLAFGWAYQRLSIESQEYLKSLPPTQRLELHGWRILLTHAGPASDKEHLSADTPEKRLRELAELAAADLILCGHSHRAFARRIDLLDSPDQDETSPAPALSPPPPFAPGENSQTAWNAEPVTFNLPTSFINPGSVGRLDDGDPRAAYMLLDIEPGRIDVHHFRLPYDLQRAVDAIHQLGLPDIFAQMLVQGRDMQSVI